MADTYTIQNAEGGLESISGRAIARQTSGTLWAVCNYGIPGSGDRMDIKVYYSIDVGVTWTLSTTISTADNGDDLIYPAVAVDSSNNVHIIYDFFDSSGGAYYAQHIVYNGSSWSGAHTVLTNTSHWFTFIIDKDDILYCFYTGDAGGDGKLYYKKSEDGGTTWSSVYTADTAGYDNTNNRPCSGIGSDGIIYVAWENYGNYGGGSASNTNIRLARKAYGGAWSGEWATAYQTGSPYVQVPLSIVVPDGDDPVVYLAFIHQSSGGRSARCAIRATNGNWTREIVDARPRSGSIMVDGNGVVRLLYQLWTGGNYKHAYRTGADAWTLAVIGNDSNTYGQGISVLWSTFPKVGDISVGIPTTGYAVVWPSNAKTIEYNVDAILPGKTFPSDTLARVTGLIHRYQPGHYSLEIFMGDVKAEWDIADYLYGDKAGVPREDGEVEPDPDLEYYRWRNLAYQDQPYEFPPHLLYRRTISSFPTEPTTPSFPVIQPEWAQGATPYELSGLFRTAEELKYGPNIGPIEANLQKAREADERAKQIAATGISQQTYAGKTAPGSSTTMPVCPAGQAPRFIDGKWECVSRSGTFRGGISNIV